ncbi:MAG: hypothetical protein RMM17_04305 [Acidobacteriota bacterium]|nr:hypothetical protein [Blastocatellia bacterium]MDW8411884.1 hypothetical protein [Acidobacteriota bacterium]
MTVGRALLLGIFLCTFTTACSRSRDLVGGLTETEAQHICVLLKRNGLNAHKVQVGSEDAVTWSVTLETPLIIGDEEVAAALYILSENDLPRVRENPLKSAFSKDSLIPTQTEENLRKLAATQEAIELTLEKISGVVSARVHVVLPNPNPLVEASKQVQASASVLLKYNTKTPPLTVEEVRNIVAPAVEGLSPSRVEVVMKEVPAPDINKFKDLKERYIKYIGLSAVSLVLVLSVLLVYFILKTRTQASKIAQLERSLALRPTRAAAQASTGS